MKVEKNEYQQFVEKIASPTRSNEYDDRTDHSNDKTLNTRSNSFIMKRRSRSPIVVEKQEVKTVE